MSNTCCEIDLPQLLCFSPNWRHFLSITRPVDKNKSNTRNWMIGIERGTESKRSYEKTITAVSAVVAIDATAKDSISRSETGSLRDLANWKINNIARPEIRPIEQ